MRGVTARGEAFRRDNIRLKKELKEHEEFKKNVVEALHAVEDAKKVMSNELKLARGEVHTQRNLTKVVAVKKRMVEEELASIRRERDELAGGVQAATVSMADLKRILEKTKENLRDAENHLDSRPTEEAVLYKYKASAEFRDSVVEAAELLMAERMESEVDAAIMKWKSSAKCVAFVEERVRSMLVEVTDERLSVIQAENAKLKGEVESNFAGMRRAKALAKRRKRRCRQLKTKLRNLTSDTGSEMADDEDGGNLGDGNGVIVPSADCDNAVGVKDVELVSADRVVVSTGLDDVVEDNEASKEF